MADNKKRRDTKGCIFRATRRDPKTGRILRAADYGLEAWPITVR